jgi:hypothetical protein
MNEKREQPKYVRPLSLNEVERKREVDRLNFENQLLASRLNKVAPVINNGVFQKDFKRHLKAESNLRRKQMKPLSLPKDLHPNSPLRKTTTASDDYSNTSSSLFDSGLYMSQKGQHLLGSNIEALQALDLQNEKDSTIRSVTDFRKQVIAPKKVNPDADVRDKHTSFDHEKLPSLSSKMHKTRNESLYEVSHSPSM